MSELAVIVGCLALLFEITSSNYHSDVSEPLSYHQVKDLGLRIPICIRIGCTVSGPLCKGQCSSVFLC